ncbi:MAG: sensor histidine kinase [Verrucomicrobiota bacterium]
MTDYSRMTKAELIARLQSLETRSAARSTSAVTDTQTQLSNTALFDSEERLRAILETAVEGIITIDERGLVESMNRAAENIFCYRADEVVGPNINMLMPSPYRDAHDDYLGAYVQTGHAKVIGKGREVLGQRKDKSIFPLDLSVSEVRLAGRRLFTGFVRDITERKEAEKALSYYAAIIESTEDAVVGKTLDGLITSWNKGAETLFGYSREEIIGKPISILIPPDYADEESAIIQRITRGESVEHYETMRRRKDGKLIGISVTISPIRAPDGAIIGASKVARDITERKRAEEKLAFLAQTLAEKNKELETIVYIASHDLRSPLVNIQGFSQELSHACHTLRQRLATGETGATELADVQRLLVEEIPEALEFIQAGVVKIDTLLAGFLRYSRLGRAALKIEPMDVNAMLSTIVQAMEFQVKRSGVDLQIEKLPDCLGDATLINQVFTNLLENALKYLSPKRPGKITISGRVEKGRAIYSVRDNGVGIAPEHQGKIFEIFHRLNPRESEGEGLGLTITQRILERHNGKIWVESEPDQGAVFFVSLLALPQAR